MNTDRGTLVCLCPCAFPVSLPLPASRGWRAATGIGAYVHHHRRRGRFHPHCHRAAVGRRLAGLSAADIKIALLWQTTIPLRYGFSERDVFFQGSIGGYSAGRKSAGICRVDTMDVTSTPEANRCISVPPVAQSILPPTT